MTTLFYNCFSGISGDMNLSAMIDLGVPEDHLLGELKKLDVDGYNIATQAAIKMGISGTKVTVHLAHETDHSNEHDHEHGHGHGHGHTEHKHIHEGHHHRTFTDIKKLINTSELSEEVKETAIAIFKEVAVAEGKIHGKTPEEVHFHEVGAVDSIVDIVGAAICFRYVNPDKVISTPPELGGGFVNCAHGHFPVPAPATMEILKDVPVTSGKVDTETTTPTGAAILKVLVDEFTNGISGIPQKIAYGIGHKDLNMPNILRVGLLKTVGDENEGIRCLLETNIDDRTSEDLAFAQEKLMGQGALDVWLTPINMKKNRAAFKLSVLCEMSHKDKMTEIIFRETGTLGVREQNMQRHALEREIVSFHSSLGTLSIKEAYYKGELINAKPEAGDLKIIADKENKPVREIRSLIEREYAATRKA